MPVVENEVSLFLRAKDEAGAVLDAVGAKVKGLGGMIAKHAETLKTAGVVMAGAGVAGLLAANQLVQAAAQIEDAMAQVNTMLSKGQDAYDMYNEKINKLITTIPVAGGKIEALQGLYQVLSSGVTTAAKATVVLEVALKAAKAGATATAVAVDAMTTIMSAYAIPAERAAEVSDILFKAVKLGKTNYESLAQAIGPVVAFTAQLGITAMETASTLATLTKAGIDTMKAGTALRGMMISFLKPSEDMKKIVAENASAWGVLTPEMEKAKSGLATARVAFEAVSGAIENMKIALEEAAPVPRALTDTLAKSRTEINTTRQEFQRHADSLKEMERGYTSAQGAIKGLQDEMAGVSLEEQKNRLAVMRIRQQADDEGRELTAGEISRIEQLEEANDRLAITQQELSIKAGEMQQAQSKRSDTINQEKAAMDGLSVTLSTQEQAMDKAKGAVADWTTNWRSAMESQMAAAEEQKTVAESSVAVWEDKLATAGESAVTLMLQTHGLQGTLGLLSKAVDGDRAALAALFPNAEAMVGVFPLVGSMAKTAAKDLEEMEDSAGSAGEAYAKTSDTTISKTQKMNAELEIAKEEMTEGTTPAMLKMKAAEVKVWKEMAKVNKETKGALGALIAYGSAALTAVGPIIAMTGHIASLIAARKLNTLATNQSAAAESRSIGPKIASAFATLQSTIQIWANTIAMYANPIGLIVIAVILLIAALYLLYTNWEEVTAAVEDFTKKAEPLLDFFRNIGSAIEDGVKSIQEFMSKVVDSVKDGGKKALNAYLSVYGLSIDDLMTAWDALMGGDWETVVSSTLGKIGKKALDTYLSMYGLSTDDLITAWDALMSGDFSKLLDIQVVATAKSAIDSFLKVFGLDSDDVLEAFSHIMKGDFKGLLKTEMGKVAVGAIKKFTEKFGFSKEDFEKRFPNFKKIFDKMMKDFFNWGAGLADQFMKGLKSKKEDVGDTVSDWGEEAKKKIGISSPPREGPLSQIRVWGAGLLEQWIEGMETKVPELQRRLDRGVATIQVNVPPIQTQAPEAFTNIESQDMSQQNNTFHVYPATNDPEEFLRMVGSRLDRKGMRI